MIYYPGVTGLVVDRVFDVCCTRVEEQEDHSDTVVGKATTYSFLPTVFKITYRRCESRIGTPDPSAHQILGPSSFRSSRFTYCGGLK